MQCAIFSWEETIMSGKPGLLACNLAHWSSGCGSSRQPACKQDTWQNYATTHAAYRPRIITSGPAHKTGREGSWCSWVGGGWSWWWTDELESELQRVFQSLSSLIHPYLILRCYLHTCYHPGKQRNLLSSGPDVYKTTYQLESQTSSHWDQIYWPVGLLKELNKT